MRKIHAVDHHHPIFLAWWNMKRRCNDSTISNYHRYGGRGIGYSTEWEDFKNFYSDMSPTWKPGLTLDRIDNNGNYCKENCQWITLRANVQGASNKRLSLDKAEEIRDLYKTGNYTLAMLARIYDVHISTVHRAANRTTWSY